MPGVSQLVFFIGFVHNIVSIIEVGLDFEWNSTENLVIAIRER